MVSFPPDFLLTSLMNHSQAANCLSPTGFIWTALSTTGAFVVTVTGEGAAAVTVTGAGAGAGTLIVGAAAGAGAGAGAACVQAVNGMAINAITSPRKINLRFIIPPQSV
jgi:hypothetical protein